MVALILADGDAPDLAYLERHWPWWFDDVELIVAADGGMRHASALGVEVDVWVGDGDSSDPTWLDALAAAGVETIRAEADKDETDTELAVHVALDRDTGGVIIVGATGGPRIDHELANIALLAMPKLIGSAGILYTPRSRITLLRGTGVRPGGTTAWAQLQGSIGDLVSLIPFGGAAEGVTTSGLGYPLKADELPFGTPRGVSNVITTEGGQVSIRDGLLLVIETPVTITP